MEQIQKKMSKIIKNYSFLMFLKSFFNLGLILHFKTNKFEVLEYILVYTLLYLIISIFCQTCQVRYYLDELAKTWLEPKNYIANTKNKNLSQPSCFQRVWKILFIKIYENLLSICEIIT